MQIKKVTEKKEEHSLMQNWYKYRLPVARFGNSNFVKSRYKVPFQYAEQLDIGSIKHIEDGNAGISFIPKNKGFELIVKVKETYKEKLHRKALWWLWFALICEWIIGFIYIHEISQGSIAWLSWIFGLHWLLLLFGFLIILIMLVIKLSGLRNPNNSTNGSSIN